MTIPHKFMCVFVTLLLCTVANGDDNKDLFNKCGAEFQKVAVCLTYATGKAPAPSKECCDATSDIKDKDPVCLCYIMEQIHKGSSPELKSMGIQEDKLLQLPSACRLTNASISDCPKLLNIPPTSPDYAIFTNASIKTPAATPGGASSSSSPDTKKDSSAAGFKNGPQISVTGTLVAAAVVLVFSSIIPRKSSY